MKIYTKYDRPPKQYEPGGGENLVETSGYMTVKQKIESMMRAGHQLRLSREQYDFANEEELDEGFTDLTRNPNFDLADVSANLHRMEQMEKIKKVQESVKQDRRGDEKKNAVQATNGEAPEGEPRE